MSRNLHENKYQNRKTRRFIEELLEAQGAQVWEIKSREPSHQRDSHLQDITTEAEQGEYVKVY